MWLLLSNVVAKNYINTCKPPKKNLWSTHLAPQLKRHLGCLHLTLESLDSSPGSTPTFRLLLMHILGGSRDG